MTSLPDGASDLYGLAPGEFVARRNALVKELKKAKRSEDAAVVAALRRPSVADHAVNAASRADPELAHRWSVAVIAVAEAQAAAIDGGAVGALRETTATLRAATAELAGAAVVAIGDEAKRNDVLAALRTATTRPGATLVAAGILGAADPEDELFAGAVAPSDTAWSTRRAARPVKARTAPEATAAPAVAQAGRPRAGQAKPAERAAPGRPVDELAARRDAARADVAARRAATIERATARVAAAEQAESDARAAADAARAGVDAAQQALRDAEAALLAAQRSLKRAVAESTAARAAATRAGRE
jgi:hypothetical protein